MSEIARISPRHARRTIGDLLPDEVVFLDNAVADHETRNPPFSYDQVSSEVFVYKSVLVDRDAAEPETLVGRVALMRIVLATENGIMLEGFVADIRHVEDAIEPADYEKDNMPDDVEDASYWMDDLKDRIAVLAVAELGDDDEAVMNGDERAFVALSYLIEATDALAKKVGGDTSTEGNPQKETLLSRIRKQLAKTPKS